MWGCKGVDSDPRPMLGKIVVKRAPGATVRGLSVQLDDARLVAKTKDVLERSGTFVANDASAAKRTSANVRIEAEVVSDGVSEDSEIGVKVRLKIEIHPATATTARYGEDAAAVGQAPLDKGQLSELAAAVQRLAERTTGDLLSAYVTRQKLWIADETEIARGLASKDGDLRLEAIRIAGARKLKAHLPVMLRLLADEDEATRDAALGAVVAMGERSSIRALAESRQMRDSYEMSKVLDAVATLGGQEAKDYLSFVAETHDDSDIRAMAKASLERLRKRDVSVAPTR
jgi:hypothetical protein